MLQFAALPAMLRALPWKLILWSALGMFVLGLMLALSMERRQNDKLKGQVKGLNDTLRSISDARDKQGKETNRNIGKAHDRIVYVDRKAREVEQAPLPGGCKSPDAVMGADL